MKNKAKESAQVKKAREKVKSHINAENKLITEKALEDTTKVIRNWLERHAAERKAIKSKKIAKNIALFDENRHTAQVSSRYVLHLQKLLKHDLTKQRPKQTLAGRVQFPTKA